MADGYDRFDNERRRWRQLRDGAADRHRAGRGSRYAVRPEGRFRPAQSVSEQAGNLANQASEGYRRATEAPASTRRAEAADERNWRDMAAYDKARDAVSSGADEAQRYVRETRRARCVTYGSGDVEESAPAARPPAPGYGGQLRPGDGRSHSGGSQSGSGGVQAARRS